MYHVKVINRAARVIGWQKSFRYLFTLRGNPEGIMWMQHTLFRVRLLGISFNCHIRFCFFAFYSAVCSLWNFPLDKNNDNRQNNSSVRWRENYRRTWYDSFRAWALLRQAKYFSFRGGVWDNRLYGNHHLGFESWVSHFVSTGFVGH